MGKLTDFEKIVSASRNLECQIFLVIFSEHPGTHLPQPRDLNPKSRDGKLHDVVILPRKWGNDPDEKDITFNGLHAATPDYIRKLERRFTICFLRF